MLYSFSLSALRFEIVNQSFHLPDLLHLILDDTMGQFAQRGSEMCARKLVRTTIECCTCMTTRAQTSRSTCAFAGMAAGGVRPPSSGIPLRIDDMLVRNPGRVVPRDSRIRRRKPGRFQRRRRKHVPQSLSRLPSGEPPLRKWLRRRDLARHSEPSFSRPARAGIRSHNARTQPRNRYTRRCSFDTSHVAYSTRYRARVDF